MTLRLVLVSLVAAMGLTIPSAPVIESWVASTQNWMNARFADWDTRNPQTADYVIVSDYYDVERVAPRPAISSFPATATEPSDRPVLPQASSAAAASKPALLEDARPATVRPVSLVRQRRSLEPIWVGKQLTRSIAYELTFKHEGIDGVPPKVVSKAAASARFDLTSVINKVCRVVQHELALCGKTLDLVIPKVVSPTASPRRIEPVAVAKKLGGGAADKLLQQSRGIGINPPMAVALRPAAPSAPQAPVASAPRPVAPKPAPPVVASTPRPVAPKPAPPVVATTPRPVAPKPAPPIVASALRPVVTKPAPPAVASAPRPVAAKPAPSVVPSAPRPVAPKLAPSVVAIALRPVVTKPVPMAVASVPGPVVTKPARPVVAIALRPVVTKPVPPVVASVPRPVATIPARPVLGLQTSFGPMETSAGLYFAGKLTPPAKSLQPTPRREPTKPSATATVVAARPPVSSRVIETCELPDDLYIEVAGELVWQDDGFGAPAMAAKALVAAAKPRFEPLEVSYDYYVGTDFELNHRNDGLSIPVESAVQTAKTDVRAPHSARDLGRAVKLTRDAVHAWVNVFTGPTVVTVSQSN